MVSSPTIRDVSRLANVSVSTVSAVINNKSIVHPETVARINAAIDKLNYTPRRSARGLASGRSGNIGFILSEQFFSRTEPFYTKVFLGAEFEARKHDLYVLLTSVDKRYSCPRDLPRFLHERNVDGLIIAGKVPSEALEDLKKFNIPVVLVDYGDPDFYGTRVLMDNIRGTVLAVRHLMVMGHRKIGYIGGESDHPSARERIQGYREEMARNGIEIQEKWVEISEPMMSLDAGERAFERLLERGELPTALVCSNDAMAIGVLKNAERHGISVPGNLSVVGFDDVTEGCMITPPLTTIRVAKEDLGSMAIQTLVDVLGNGRPRLSEIRVGVELIARSSTAVPRSNGR
ncbi:MAG: LacI family DNA-binding transcriptional regulator [bacterium]